MRKVREVLRLKHALGMSERLIAEAVGAGKSAVGEYIRRARVIGLTWPVPDGLDDAELERRLFSPPGFHVGPTKPQPHWPTIQEELKGRGVTLLLLWEEYRAEHADGYGYSRFCDLYVEWRKRITPTMRQTHVAGEKLFVDWAGDTIPVFDAITGAEHDARIFVAALGASNYTYAEARWTETLPDWIGAHVNALSAIGGVPKAVVCDNLKAGITRPSRYEPGINRTLSGLGRPLRLCRAAHPGAQTARQGQGGSGSPDCRAVRIGEAEKAAVLLARRAERGDQGVCGGDQREGDEGIRQEPA